MYIIFSAVRDRYYIGRTSGGIETRLKKHNYLHRGFTGKYSDWVLKFKEEFTSKTEAIKREREIKSWKSRVKIEKLISSE